MPCCYSPCIADPLIVEQWAWKKVAIYRKSKIRIGKRGKREFFWQPSQSLDVSWRKFRAGGSQLNLKKLHCRRDTWARSSSTLILTCAHIPLPIYTTISTLGLFIKTLFKFPCFRNILPDNISQYLFSIFLADDTSYLCIINDYTWLCSVHVFFVIFLISWFVSLIRSQGPGG